MEKWYCQNKINYYSERVNYYRTKISNIQKDINDFSRTRDKLNSVISSLQTAISKSQSALDGSSAISALNPKLVENVRKKLNSAVNDAGYQEEYKKVKATYNAIVERISVENTNLKTANDNYTNAVNNLNYYKNEMKKIEKDEKAKAAVCKV
ncbi:MAG: hypothetical protein Q4Q31_04695 [Bacillota bacterium]|nr:hypothetical protein [Bacillota bacterium]